MPGDVFRQHPGRRQDSHAAALIDAVRVARLEGVVLAGAVVGMRHPRPHPLGYLGDAQHRAAVVKQLDDIPVFDAPGGGIRGVKAHRMPVIAVFQDPVAGYLPQPACIGIVVGMEGIPGVGSDKLEGIFFRQLRVIAFPAGDIARQRRPFLVIRQVCFRAFRDKLDFAAVSAQFFAFFRIALGVKVVGGIAIAAFIKPAQAGVGL